MYNRSSCDKKVKYWKPRTVLNITWQHYRLSFDNLGPRQKFRNTDNDLAIGMTFSIFINVTYYYRYFASFLQNICYL